MDRPRKVTVSFNMAPGDIVCLTGAIRDVLKAYPTLRIQPKVYNLNLFQYNPRVLPLNVSTDHTIIVHYDHSKYPNDHLVAALRAELCEKLEVPIVQGPNTGELYLQDEELDPIGLGNYWIVMSGGKFDGTCKWWPYYQSVINLLQGQIRFVQCGQASDWHRPLENAIDLVGKTSIRQFLSLLYHAKGLFSPVTFGVHALRALSNHSAPLITLIGGREPPEIAKYSNQTQLLTEIECKNCWRTMCEDSDTVSEDKRCLAPDRRHIMLFPKCMTAISPETAAEAIKAAIDRPPSTVSKTRLS